MDRFQRGQDFGVNVNVETISGMKAEDAVQRSEEAKKAARASGRQGAAMKLLHRLPDGDAIRVAGCVARHAETSSGACGVVAVYANAAKITGRKIRTRHADGDLYIFVRAIVCVGCEPHGSGQEAVDVVGPSRNDPDFRLRTCADCGGSGWRELEPSE
jgi:hypothetical protein